MLFIEHFALKPFTFFLTRPFSIAHGAVLTQREGIILEIISRNGYMGCGEASPLVGVSQESLNSALHQLKCLERKWVGCAIPCSAKELCLRLETDIDRNNLHPSVVFALESAVLTLAAASHGISVAEFLGGKSPQIVKTACLIQGDVTTISTYGAQYAAEGYLTFKLKVGNRNIPLDVQKVKMLSHVIADNAKIRLDANASWTLDEAVTFSREIEKSKIDFIEEPCRDERDYENLFIRSDFPWGVEAHSFKRPLEDWKGFLGFKYVVCKPMVHGGVIRFLSLLELSRKLGLRVIVSSAFESPVGLKMCANLAALTGEPCGLGTSDWIVKNNLNPVGPGGIIPPERLV